MAVSRSLCISQCIAVVVCDAVLLGSCCSSLDDTASLCMTLAAMMVTKLALRKHLNLPFLCENLHPVPSSLTAVEPPTCCNVFALLSTGTIKTIEKAEKE